MYSNAEQKLKGGFPDPLASTEVKESKEYGLKYAKAIERQWGKMQESNSLHGERNRVFDRCRSYANGTQDTNIYKRLLNSMDPNAGEGSLMNVDFTPVPILPKFVRIVVNKILSRNPYPNLEAIDPLSSSEKNREKNKIKMQVQAREKLAELKKKTGVVLDQDPEKLPETLEEAEILMDTNIKTDAEISAQIATNMTLSWNNFNDNIFRRCVNDLATLGMAVVQRFNDPNYGIATSYVDPNKFIHSRTEDPNFDDLVYAGHVKTIPIQELKRMAGEQFSEEQYAKIAKKYQGKYGNNSANYGRSTYNTITGRTQFGYDEYLVDVLDFEYISVDCVFFEEKENRFGNKGFYYKGFDYKEKQNSVFERKPHKMDIKTVYKGSYVLGTKDYLFNYGRAKNVPKNVHDISKARMSYSVVATNLRDMMPKSMVDSCVGFADMLQITHLKIQQSIAKAKPDGLIIDIEGLENVQLGKGGELQPLELHDIYEQTGVFYYRSKNPEGGFQNPPVREIGNSIRNINELIRLYNHYLQMIRDTTGINEAMDASSPKGEALVGVQQQAINAGNNAIYDITNSAMVLYKKVCEDIVKCLQILPEDSVIYSTYQNAVGKENMRVLSSFNDLPMYNFGVQVVKEMEDEDKAYLEQNIQAAIAQKEIDLEDALAIRNMKDINQAERLLIVRRKKRMQKAQEQQMQQIQAQGQQQQQAQQMEAQSKQQEIQMVAQIEQQKIQMKGEMELRLATAQHEFNKEIEIIRAEAMGRKVSSDKDVKVEVEKMKDDRKDDRVKKQAVEQSKLISQRQGQRGELQDETKEDPQDIMSGLLDKIMR
tara:strand:- start:889 stop:3354 length:2466 start_codon:yes stop_codon:yes gene_type:complete